MLSCGISFSFGGGEKISHDAAEAFGPQGDVDASCRNIDASDEELD